MLRWIRQRLRKSQRRMMREAQERLQPALIERRRRARAKTKYDWDSLLKRGEAKHWLADPRTGAARTTEELEAANEIVRTSRKCRWHIAHLPYECDGKAAKSAWDEDDWRRLDAEITERAKHWETRPLVLDGCVLRTLPNSRTCNVNLSAKLASFEQPVSFDRGQTFSTIANFDGALFRQGCSLEGVCFEKGLRAAKAVFFGELNCDDIVVTDGVSFNRALVLGAARFCRAIMGGTIDFSSVCFRSSAQFIGAKFKQAAVFARACFCSSAYFTGAKFENDARFSRSTFINRAEFTRANFSQTADFSGCQFGRLAAFEGAEVQPNTTFDSAEFLVIARAIGWSWVIGLFLLLIWVFAMLMTLQWGSEAAFWSSVFSGILLQSAWLYHGGTIVCRSDIFLERFARAFRHLNTLAQRFNNRKDAARFLRQELRAVRLRAVTNPIERLLSWLYDLSAEYGDSFARPAAFLVASILGFALCFASFEDHSQRISDVAAVRPRMEAAQADLIASLQFSLRNVFAPFNVWTFKAIEARGCDFTSRVLAVSPPPTRDTASGEEIYENCAPGLSGVELETHRLWARLSATVQSVLSIFLVFALALAGRRQFQNSPS